jgi:hypothetical protein
MSKRRSSIMKTAPILGLRLEVENVLSSLSGQTVPIEEFISAIKTQPSIAGVMKHISFDGIRSKYRSGKISRDDCVEILSSIIANSSQKTTSSNQEDEYADSSEAIVEKQSMALNIEYNPALTTIHIGLMDADDPRVRLGPENKLIVRSDTDIEELVKTYTVAKSIVDQHCIGTIFDYAERGVLKAKQKEIRLLDEAIEEFRGQTKTMASIVLASEDRMINALKEAEKQHFVSSVMNAGSSSGGGKVPARRASVMKDISKALDATSGDSSLPENTPARLALKLNDLQKRALEAEKDYRHYQDMEQMLEDDPEAEILPPPHEAHTSYVV